MLGKRNESLKNIWGAELRNLNFIPEIVFGSVSS
jgi:hypothetical protein